MMSQKSKQNAKNICIQLTTASPYLQYTSDVQATLTGTKEKEEIQTCAKKLFSVSNHMKFKNFKHWIGVCPLKFSLVFFHHYFPTNQRSAQSLQQQQQRQQQRQQLSASARLGQLGLLAVGRPYLLSGWVYRQPAVIAAAANTVRQAR